MLAVKFVLHIVCHIMTPTWTGKPGKMGKHFPVRELISDWKSRGILPKILGKKQEILTLKKLEKSGKFVCQKK